MILAFSSYLNTSSSSFAFFLNTAFNSYSLIDENCVDDVRERIREVRENRA